MFSNDGSATSQNSNNLEGNSVMNTLRHFVMKKVKSKSNLQTENTGMNNRMRRAQSID